MPTNFLAELFGTAVADLAVVHCGAIKMVKQTDELIELLATDRNGQRIKVKIETLPYLED